MQKQKWLKEIDGMNGNNLGIQYRNGKICYGKLHIYNTKYTDISIYVISGYGEYNVIKYKMVKTVVY